MEIKIENLTKVIKKQVILSDINLTISGIYGLLGSNGAGKTTLMKILAGLLSFNNGRIFINDSLISTKKYVKRTNQIGYLPQDFMIYPDLTMYDVLEHIVILQGGDTSISNKDKINKVVEQVNLSDHLNKKIRDLSGGMQKRVGIAQLLLRQPSILIFDEPTAGLDVEERIRFRNLLKRLGKNHIVIISSHIVEDIEFLCTKIGVIKAGGVIFEGEPAVLKSLANHFTYEINVPHNELENIITLRDVVQMDEEKEHVVVRVLSDTHLGKAVQPRLMDGYLALIKEDHYG